MANWPEARGAGGSPQPRGVWCRCARVRSRWRGDAAQATFALTLAQLAAELPVDRTSPSHIERTLDPAHAQLVACGFLREAMYEDRLVAGKKRAEVWVRYAFADALGAPAVGAAVGAPPARAGDDAPPAPRSPHVDPREDPEYVRDMVA